MVFKLIPDKNNHDALWLLSGISLLIAFLIVNTIISFLGIIKVEADPASGKINFTRLFKKEEIAAAEIAGYYVSVSKSRGGTSYGRIIETTDRKIRELNPGNLKDIDDIEEFFKSRSIKCLGERNSFYPLSKGL